MGVSRNHDEQDSRSPASLIYRLYQDSLPWTTGGEYLAFYRILKRLVVSWKSVGLDPVFIFDGKLGVHKSRYIQMADEATGSAPPGKHETIVARLNENINRAQLFYTTSPASRSSPSFSRYSSMLPPFCSHVFTQALADMGIETLFVPLGEADGVCVVMAEQRGGFVLGQDSDFVILVGEGGKGRGYVPFEMISWYESEDQEESGTGLSTNQTDARLDPGFTTVSNRRGHHGRQTRESPLLPPLDARRPILSLTVYPPAALRQRLRLPSNVLPLFGALVGNDYTPPQAASHFFEPSLSLGQRIEKVARVLREQLFIPNAQKTGNSAGDHAVDLVWRVIKKMLVRDFYTETEGRALADAIVEATLQYTLPTLGQCCPRYPFCGSLDTGCRAELGLPESVEWYSDAHSRGELRGVRHAFLFPDSVIPYQVMEDPSKASIKLQRLCRVRKAAWEIADEAVGLRFGRAKHEEMEADGDEKSETTLVEQDDGEARDKKEVSPAAGPSRTVVEYVRSSNRIIARDVQLDAASPEEQRPRCLRPLEERLQLYLEAMGCSIPSVTSLPVHLQPLVAIIRFCIADTREPWRHTEVEAVLRACIGTYASWQREKNGDAPTKKEMTIEYPFLTNRKAQIVAYLQAVMTDAHILAESLLLSDHASCTDSRSDIDVTHLRTYVFYNGSALHLFLSAQEPQGWKWSPKEQEAFDRCLSAITEGLEDRILGFNDGRAPNQQTEMSSKRPLPQREIDTRSTQLKTNSGYVGGKPSRAEEFGNWRKGRPAQGAGRFDLLGSMTGSS